MDLKDILFPATPGQWTFTVLDGAALPELRGILQQMKPEHACLYRGALPDDIAQVAPYLVRLQTRHKFTRWVLEEVWGKHCGIFGLVSDDITLTILRRHFRRFTKVKSEDGRTLLFRFYDPRVWSPYIVTCNPEELEFVFGPVAKILCEDKNGLDVLQCSRAAGKLIEEHITLESYSPA
jgi:hypothetical protein